MPHVFLYGTLLDLELLEIVLGYTPDVVSASLHNHRSTWVEKQAFPMIYALEGHQADGVCLKDASAEDLARLNFYEGPFSYALKGVQVHCGDQTIEAQTYFPTPGRYQPGEDWNIDAWSQQHGALRKIAAAEIMARFGVMSAAEVNRRYPVILARAQATLNARTNPSPVVLRLSKDVQDVDIIQTRLDHDNWYMMEDITLTHPRFNGSQSPDILRGVFVMADAVTVLPYDPVRDVVLLLEQFRIGAHRRGDPHPWCLEAIAGRIDAGETPEFAAHRETREEAGLTLRELHQVSRYYPSSGAVTEYLTSYIGITDLPDTVAGLGGVVSEDEDIRTMVVPFDTLMAALDSGEVENGPLVLKALFLSRMRDELRAKG